MNSTTILFTQRLDAPSPISTIHRKVGERISSHEDNYSIIAFGNGTVEEIDETIVFSGPVQKYEIPRLLASYAGKYDIVHTAPKKRDILAWLSKFRGAKIVHTLHAAPNRQAAIDAQRKFVNNAHHVTAVSDFVKDWAVKEYGEETPITVIPNGVDLRRFRPHNSSGGEYIAYIGRCVDRKNPRLVIDLAKEMPDHYFKIRVSSFEEGDLYDLAKSIPNIEVVPRLSVEELSEFYAGASAVLCPYEREGFGMVVIEAMACGTPVIGLDSGNLPSLIDEGRNGILCDSLEIEAWATAVRHLQENQKEYSPRETVKGFSWDNVYRKYLDVYDDLVGEI